MFLSFECLRYQGKFSVVEREPKATQSQIICRLNGLAKNKTRLTHDIHLNRKDPNLE